MSGNPKKPRLAFLDSVRGLCVVSMVLYHCAYDLVHLKGIPVSWLHETPGYAWQQSICWTFLLLSGFCWQLSSRHLKRGILLVGLEALISLVTFWVMPSQLILFGVLSLLGLSTLLMIPLHRLFQKVPPLLGLLLSALLFFLFRDVSGGYLGFEGLTLFPLPKALYQSILLAPLGFPPAGFYSADYFPLIPWFFLFAAGYFLWSLLSRREAAKRFLTHGLPPLSFVGRHSLLIYLLHQPVLLGLFLLIS